MNVVDSSGWLEYFADGPNADFFAAAIEASDALVVPTVSVYEVYKRVRPSRVPEILAKYRETAPVEEGAVNVAG